MSTHTCRNLLRFSALAIAGAGIASPQAVSAPYEPNDTFLQAAGPLVGGQVYDGAIENEDDKDFFYFNVSGQRQLDIAITMVSEEPDGDVNDIEAWLQDADGASVSNGYAYTQRPGETSHIRITSPNSQQYVLQLNGTSVPSTYQLRVDPADAVIQTDPGLVATLGAAEEADDVQRIYVDGVLVGESRARAVQKLSLGSLPTTSQITFEAVNQTGSWSWNFGVTNQVARARTTILQERQEGDYDARPVGTVRRVTFSPSGGIISSCGLALASTACDIAPMPTPAPVGTADNPMRVWRGVSIERRSGRYRGRVSANSNACQRYVRVELRRKGKGSRSYGSTISRADGSWTIKSRPKPGKIYAFVAEQAVASGTNICLTARSSALRRVR